MNYCKRGSVYPVFTWSQFRSDMHQALSYMVTIPSMNNIQQFMCQTSQLLHIIPLHKYIHWVIPKILQMDQSNCSICHRGMVVIRVLTMAPRDVDVMLQNDHQCWQNHVRVQYMALINLILDRFWSLNSQIHVVFF